MWTTLVTSYFADSSYKIQPANAQINSTAEHDVVTLAAPAISQQVTFLSPKKVQLTRLNRWKTLPEQLSAKKAFSIYIQYISKRIYKINLCGVSNAILINNVCQFVRLMPWEIIFLLLSNAFNCTCSAVLLICKCLLYVSLSINFVTADNS